jgi:hypothetical protein
VGGEFIELDYLATRVALAMGVVRRVGGKSAEYIRIVALI